MSIRGIRIRYSAIAMGIIAIILGSYLTFFQTKGFEKTTATIVSIEELPKNFEDEDTSYDVTVEYTVNGQTYREQLNYYSPFFKVGKSIDVRYDPKDPSVVHGGKGFGIYVMVVGIALLAGTILSIIREKQSMQKLREWGTVGKDVTYPAPFLGEERELYFLTDLGTPKYGHRIEDAERHVLIEAKMTKYTLTTPFGFDFIDHVNGKTRAHLVGHEETTEWDTFLLDPHCTFQFDGEDIWKHLKRNGIRVDSSFGGGNGKLVGVNYTIYRDDMELARVESTSRYVHEEDAAVHGKLGNLISSSRFFRIWTREQNLELLFLTLIAFARTEASADNGGNYKTIFNTLKNQVNKRKENGEQ